MPNLRFFGSTVDAIAPQEQNVLSQYRTHNWNVEAANAAAAERARAASINAWQFAQQNEQQQAQQGWANQVNLLQFAERARGNREQERLVAEQVAGESGDKAYRQASGLADFLSPEDLQKNYGGRIPPVLLKPLMAATANRQKQLTAVATAKAAEQERKAVADLLEASSNGSLASLSPEEVSPLYGLPVEKVKPLLERGLKLYTDGVAQQLNVKTAELILKRRGAKEPGDLAPADIDALRGMAGNVPASVRYDAATGKWSTGPTQWESEGAKVAALRAANRQAPAPTPSVDLSQFRTGTNAAPAIRVAPGFVAPTVNLTPSPSVQTNASAGLTASQKARLANALAANRPELSRAQVVEIVNRGPPMIQDPSPQTLRPDYQFQLPTNTPSAPLPAAVPFGRTGGATVMDFSGRAPAPIPAVTNAPAVLAPTRPAPMPLPVATNTPAFRTNSAPPAVIAPAATVASAPAITIPESAPSIKQFADQIKEGVRLGRMTEQEALARLAALEKGILAAFKAGRMRDTIAMKNLMDLGATKSEARTFLEDEE